MGFEAWKFEPEMLPAPMPAPHTRPDTDETVTLGRLYAHRFAATGLDKRQRVWRALCRGFFDRLVSPTDTILDLACGYGEFINNIRAGRKYAIDLNPDAALHLAPDVRFVHGSATDLRTLPEAGFDTAFTSNLLEHFRSKAELDRMLQAVRSRLKPGGRLLLVGPNIRYAYREYWDFYDHHLALSDRSLAEALTLAGFRIDAIVPRFLPYTMNGRTPAHPLLVRLYLALPAAWRLMGKQFLVIASRPT